MLPCKNEISEDLRSRIVDLHKVRNLREFRYLSVHSKITVYKWKWFSTPTNLPRSGRPVNMTPKAQPRMFNDVKKNPRETAKGLKE